MDFTQLLKLPRRGIPQLDAFSQARRFWRRVRVRPDAARIEGAFAVLRDPKLPMAVRRAFRGDCPTVYASDDGSWDGLWRGRAFTRVDA